ncbi:hypothetical protein U27_03703 [Candidatus Vecturithrix granuli]|uniref:Uncharacterized protein n=1 Tax=Vecturithrix granuli TaxID=1499967 RepID=A0A081BWN4_VECG1|nr:hypothetical protein U27_03703 [Candidatus Vecturithrix granuli]
MGAIKVLPQIQELLQRYNLEVSVELKGTFCLGPCADGIIMKYGETLFKHIRPHNVEEKFQQEILPLYLYFLKGGCLMDNQSQSQTL